MFSKGSIIRACPSSLGCTEIFMQPPHISRLIFAYAYITTYA